MKLGDFGLSKMIQSHDFASTYVGTPFYMSPEICAAEKYTLKSDIWSLGCIIYELCSREPPFNAKSHFQLVQRIKEGKVAPLPGIYSAELMAVIKDCLKVNPERRPDTAQLLNLPVVRLMRKEKEVVEFSKMLKAKEDALDKRIRELDHKLHSVENDKACIRQEIDSSLRREWEVKARLEIDRLVAQEIENLQKKFEEEVQTEVNARVDTELAKYTVTKKVSIIENEITEFSSSLAKSDYPFSSIGGGSGDEFPSTTDITELSYDSPEPPQRADLKKNARTPFGRAQTMFAAGQGGHAGTPMDIEMASPSPITIASLSLSPRRNAATKAPHNPANIFTADQVITGDPRWEATRDSSGLCVSDSESDDDEVAIPSPTRMIKSIKNPFQSKNRPALHATRTAPTGRLMQSKQALPPHSKTANNLTGAMSSNPDLLGGVRPQGSSNALRERCTSPNRRLSKIPSATNLNGANNNNHSSGSDSAPNISRQASFCKPNAIPEGSGLVSKVGAKAKAAAATAAAAAAAATTANNTNNNGVRGRTLVELQQARAGGRPMSAVLGVGENGIATGTGPQSPTKRAFREHFAGYGRTGSAVLDPAPVWDPEKDEMPSPFLNRRKGVGRF